MILLRESMRLPFLVRKGFFGVKSCCDDGVLIPLENIFSLRPEKGNQ